MIGLYDFMTAINRYQSGNLRKDDAKILWAGITTAGNSGADISRGDYATAMTQAYDELEGFIIEVHSYDDPCVLKLPIEGGATDFMSWIKNTVVS